MARAEQDVPQPIYTIGHSNHLLETFLALLHAHAIEVLIDTRSSPFSRYSPHFSRDALKAAVQDAGIKYGFYGRELGGRPENQAFYDPEGRADYAQIAASELFQAGLARLVAGAAKRRTALLCSEENPSVCHRRLLISRVLFDQKVRVCHIRGDGRLEDERELRGREDLEHCRQRGLFDDAESTEAVPWKSLKSLQSASPKALPPISSDD